MVEHREPTGGEPMTQPETRRRAQHPRRRARPPRRHRDRRRARGRARCAPRAPARCSRPTIATSSPRCAPSLADVATLGDVPVEDIELAIVLGGDGTILRAAELVRDGTAPVLGINMGHVGFLAEIERDDMDDAVRRVIARDYAVEERLALQVRVKDADDAVVYETWALNEATVEKASRERMLEVVIEVDGRPAVDVRLRRHRGVDPDRVDRLQLLGRRPGRSGRPSRRSPSCRCRRTRCSRKPLVVGPEHRRRDRGARADERHRHPVVRRPALARPAAGRPRGRAPLGPVRCGWRACIRRAFTDRLVRKFRLPVEGWRGPAPTHGDDAVIEEMRLRDLGVIAEATLPIGRGFTAITGETGAGKTMVVTGLGLLLGAARRLGRGALGRRAGVGRRRVDRARERRRRRSRARGRRRPRAARRRHRRAVRRPHRSRARVAAARPSAAARPRPACSPDLADELVVVHGQSDQLRLRSAVAQRDALDRFGGDERAVGARRLSRRVRALARPIDARARPS